MDPEKPSEKRNASPQVFSPSQQSCGKYLQRKLVKLTFEIEDCEKTIPLLENAIREGDEFHDKQYKEVERELVSRFERQSKINKEKLLSLFQECDQTVEAKKELASELQELLQRRKVRIRLIKACL